MRRFYERVWLNEEKTLKYITRPLYKEHDKNIDDRKRHFLIKKFKKTKTAPANDMAISPWHDLDLRPKTGNAQIDDELDVI